MKLLLLILFAAFSAFGQGQILSVNIYTNQPKGDFTAGGASAWWAESAYCQTAVVTASGVPGKYYLQWNGLDVYPSFRMGNRIKTITLAIPTNAPANFSLRRIQ